MSTYQPEGAVRTKVEVGSDAGSGSQRIEKRWDMFAGIFSLKGKGGNGVWEGCVRLWNF